MNHRRRSSCLRFGPVFGLWLFAAQPANALQQDPVLAVDAVGMTVGDLDRSVDFYSKVLSFEKVSDVEVWGEDYERLQGVFGLRMRVVRMRLGEELIELTEYLAPRGRPIPADSRSHDRWFQHIAIIVSDMDRAYRWLRENKVTHASTGPQRLPDWNKNAGGIRAFYFKDPDGHHLEILVPARQGRSQVAASDGQALPGHRSHGRRGRGNRGQPEFLPGHAGAQGSGGERELRHGAGASQQCLRRPSAHYRAAGGGGARHRVSGVRRAAGRTPDAGR